MSVGGYERGGNALIGFFFNVLRVAYNITNV